VNTIIFSRVWTPALIETALKFARHRMPECRIVHLHNSTSGVGWDDAYDMGDIFESSMRFLNTNENAYGPNDRMFEKASIARWNMLLHWMCEHKVDEVFHCDSDVLLYQNPWTTPHYKSGKVMVSGNGLGDWHAGNAMVTKDYLITVWDSVFSMVSDRTMTANTVNDIEAWSRGIRRDGGYSEQNRIIDGCSWDHHMGEIGGWESEGGYKKLTWKDGNPYCKWLQTGEDIRLVNLHCWGDAEGKMPEYAKLGGMQ